MADHCNRKMRRSLAGILLLTLLVFQEPPRVSGFSILTPRKTTRVTAREGSRPSSVALQAEPTKRGGTARFTALEEAGSVTNVFDFVLSLLTSDVGSIVLGLVGLCLCVGHRLMLLDVLATESMGQETRADLLAVFASGAVLLNGVSKLDVTSVLAESVTLEGERLPQPVFSLKQNSDPNLTWALEAILSATPAQTAVLLSHTEEEGWRVDGRAGIVPQLSDSPSLQNVATPILDRFLQQTNTKETYLPTLQALPGRFEFTYLPPNAQGALLLPISSTSVLVLGSDTAKSFTPRDVAWSQVLASRINSFSSN